MSAETRSIAVIPEYFPRPGSIVPLLRAERIVVRGDVQYSRQSWQNRTRIRNPDGWQWLTVPVETGQFGASINQTRIAYHDGWATRHIKGLRYNYSTTPFHAHYAPDIEALLEQRHATLGALTSASLKLFLSWLGHDPEWIHVTPDTEAPDIPLLEPAIVDESPYRQNYTGFIPGMSALDILFNLGPHAIHELNKP